jgi:hypothetical protein
LSGVGIEILGRDINWGLPAGISEAHQKVRQDTAEGGPIYAWRVPRKVHPYAKYLFGYGSIDFGPLPQFAPTYTHENKWITGPGGGADFNIVGGLWARADWEYQFWPKLFDQNALNPTGFTFGVTYDFRKRRIIE